MVIDGIKTFIDFDWDGIEKISLDDDNPSIALPKNVEIYDQLSIGNKNTGGQSQAKPVFNWAGSAMQSYIKRNWIFLSVIFIIWMMTGTNNYGLDLSKIPVIGQLYKIMNSKGLGGILRYFTATWNGPVGIPPFSSGLNI